MSELMLASQQQSDEHDGTRIVDVEKAHSMAIASNRNELNRVAFKAIAIEHMKNPDEPKSPMRAEIKAVGYNTFSSVDPSVRIVTAHDGLDGRYAYTAEEAIEEAQKERAEADKQAQIAAVRHDALKDL